MKNLTKEELLEINGGFNLNGTLINSLVRGINSLLELGRSLGTAIRRSSSQSLCPIN